jgi:hypothetical protein
MSVESLQNDKTALSTRRVLLLVLIVGLGAGIAAYTVGEVLATNAAQANQTGQSINGAFLTFGQRGLEGGRYALYKPNSTGTRLSFRALSTVSNVSVTGFSIVDSNHISLSLTWTGTGSAPALTLVSVAPGLSGSNTLSADWGTSTTVSISMVGTGALSSSSTCLRVLVVPLTGP